MPKNYVKSITLDMIQIYFILVNRLIDSKNMLTLIENILDSPIEKSRKNKIFE